MAGNLKMNRTPNTVQHWKWAAHETERTLGNRGGAAAGDVRVVACGCPTAGESGEQETCEDKFTQPAVIATNAKRLTQTASSSPRTPRSSATTLNGRTTPATSKAPTPTSASSNTPAPGDTPTRSSPAAAPESPEASTVAPEASTVAPEASTEAPGVPTPRAPRATPEAPEATRRNNRRRDVKRLLVGLRLFDPTNGWMNGLTNRQVLILEIQEGCLSVIVCTHTHTHTHTNTHSHASSSTQSHIHTHSFTFLRAFKYAYEYICYKRTDY